MHEDTTFVHPEQGSRARAYFTLMKYQIWKMEKITSQTDSAEKQHTALLEEKNKNC